MSNNSIANILKTLPEETKQNKTKHKKTTKETKSVIV